MTCETESADVFPVKHPSATLDYAVNFEPECAKKWIKWTDYATNVRIRVYSPGGESGYELEATIGGRSAGRQPRWPTYVGAIIVDGSITWTVRALSSGSLIRSVAGTPVWVADNGITVTNQSITGMVATANMAGGADGNDYAITVTATLSDGTIVPKTVILPVRLPIRVCE
jgi:hypothetical protein